MTAANAIGIRPDSFWPDQREPSLPFSHALTGDRRRFQRTGFDSPLQGWFGEKTAFVIDLSVAGVLVEHDVYLPANGPVSLSFDWYELIEVDTRVLRTEEVAGRFRSALEVIVPSGPLVRSLALRLSFARIARLESLVEASKLVNSTIEPDALIGSILTMARKELGVAHGTVYFMDGRTHEIWTEVVDATGVRQVVRFPLGRGLAGHVAGTAEPLMLDDAYADPRFDPLVDLVSGFRSGSMLCVPVRDREQTIVGVLQFVHEQHRSFSDDDLRFLQAISEHIAIAMRNSALVRDALEKNRMNTELRLGHQIQRRLLPQPPDDWKCVEVAVSSVPCLEVGGDYHDFIDLPDGDLGLAIGDVSGKGVAAALIMSSAQAALRIAAPDEPDLERLLSRLSELLYRTTPPEKFATFFFARYCSDSGILRYVNAGHNAPFVSEKGTIRRLNATGPPLGILAAPTYREASVPFGIGSTLILYTDGFNEAVNPKGEQFGMDRWESLVREARPGTASEISAVLTEAITSFEEGGQPADDRTLVVLRRTE